MARIRSIKPEFFRHEELFEAEKESGLPLRLAFAGLWTASDRDGRFKWKPRELKLDCLPYDDVDFGRVLAALERHGFISKYVVAGAEYGFIPAWTKHQHVNQREAKSLLPSPSENSIVADAGASTCTHVHAPGEGKGREGEEVVTDVTTPLSKEELPSKDLFLGVSRSSEPRARSTSGASRLSQDWDLSVEDLAFAQTILVAERIPIERDKFRDYWHAANGPPSLKRSWPAAWRNWCRRAVEISNEKHRQISGGSGRESGKGRGFAAYAFSRAKSAGDT